jgi:tetratricopeptide (TPR) repeat protein
MMKNASSLVQKGEVDEAIRRFKELIERFPNSHEAGEAHFALGELHLKKNDILEAKNSYQMVVTNFPDIKFISEAQTKLDELSMKMLFSPLLTTQSQSYEVKSGDILAKIASNFNTTVELIKQSNNLKDDRIRVGMKLKIWTGKFSLVVDKSQHALTLKSNEEVMKIYPVSTGFNNSTPVGNFKIISKLIDPVWYKAGAVVPPESPENILGSRWLGLSIAGYGIHGTTDPSSVGKAITQGCIRMLNPDVEELYTILPIGTEVTIVE